MMNWEMQFFVISKINTNLYNEKHIKLILTANFKALELSGPSNLKFLKSGKFPASFPLGANLL